MHHSKGVAALVEFAVGGLRLVAIVRVGVSVVLVIDDKLCAFY
jgi:hypothetical protein